MNADSHPDIGELARALWGEPNMEHSTKDDVRFGRNGSKSVCRSKRTWFDHEAGKGGGYNDLYEKVHGKRPASDSLIIATYDYHDEHGELIFQVVRKLPKKFVQRRPNGSGGWIWNMNGVQRVPYRLPELMAAPDDATVYIVEGEKDSDALHACGLIATTNAGGAGKWWRQMSEFLRGRQVIILPDFDEAGEKHAADVVTKLKGIARSVHVIRLPDLPPKDDVSDWLKAENSAEDLVALTMDAMTAPEPEPEPPPPPDAFGIWDAGDDDYVIPPRGWLLGTSFCRRFLSSLIADGGVGKTALRIAQLVSLALGRSLTGEHVFDRCRVLIVSLEDDRDELRRRVHAVMRHHEIKPADVRGWLFLWAPKGLRLAEMDGGTPVAGEMDDLLRQQIIDLKLDIVSLDPFVKSHGLEENSNGAIDFVCTMLATIAIEHNCAIDLPHHTRKGTGVPGDAGMGRGASSMKDAARLVYTLNPMTREEAQQFDVTETERRFLIRVDGAKVNIASPAAEATWFRLIGVPLDNGNGLYPAGDTVQTVERWYPPKTWDVDSITLNRVLDDIDAGMPNGSRYSAASKAGERAAWQVVSKHAPDKTERQAREIINTWVRNKVLVAEDYEDPTQRKTLKGLKVLQRPGPL